MAIVSAPQLRNMDIDAVLELKKKLEELSAVSKNSQELLAKLENTHRSLLEQKSPEGKRTQLYVLRTEELEALKNYLNELSAVMQEITGGVFGKNKINRVIKTLNSAVLPS